MILNNIKIAWRNITKRKVYSSIHIIGLAIGISASALIYMLVNYHYSFDTQHKDKERVYRVVSNNNYSGTEFLNSGVPVPMLFNIKEVIPQAEVIPFITKFYDVKVKKSDDEVFKYYDDANIIYTDKNYFSLFDYKWLAGDKETALKAPNSIVLSEKRAKKYFPNESLGAIIGKTLDYNDVLMTVTGIVKRFEGNTDFIFESFMSLSTIQTSEELQKNFNWNDWSSSYTSTQLFLKIPSDLTTEAVASSIAKLAAKHVKPNENFKTDYFLQPLANVHFNAELGNYNDVYGNETTLKILSGIALFLLLLACANFINLATAQSLERSKEVGVRKSIGAKRKQLINQFLTESFLITLLATLLAVALIPVLKYVFSDFIPSALDVTSIISLQNVLFLIVLLIAITLLAGLYPALFLSKYKPALVLKGNFAGKTGKSSFGLRSSLTIFQFIIAQFFILGTLVVNNQISFSLHKDLGYNRDAIVNISTPWKASTSNKEVLFEKIKQISNVELVAFGKTAPASRGTNSTSITYKNDSTKITTQVEYKHADANYYKLYGLKLKSGRFPIVKDSITEYAINETYAKRLGFKNADDAIGKMLEGGMVSAKVPIVGVFKDFHTKSTKKAIEPLAFVANKNRFTTIHFKLKANTDWQQSLATIESEWNKLYPDAPFQYNFFDESIAKFYKQEQQMASLLKWSAIIAIFISCLGVFGLAVFMANKRAKEIGVHKVLGASVQQILWLLVTNFVKLITIAFIITAPLAWYFMNDWLSSFAYATSIKWWFFAVTILLTIVIALISVSWQSIRAATQNPVKSLRSE